MSKRALKKYLAGLDQEALAGQLLDLYDRFPQVKTYYDFVFNPREDRLLQEAKSKIRREFFPQRRKRPKARRSIAQKYIRHFKTLGMEPHLLADLMAFNLETTAEFEKTRNCPEAFYRSIYKSYEEWTAHMVHHGIFMEFQLRHDNFLRALEMADWPNLEDFLARSEQMTL
ncbi:DUF6155 family protein [Robiginitalea sp. SC105]|uniref:DUF6155 family protein n=1 Tax=Robiginitalea sp. SC105 TaxID=2762332 RepID=UPI00163989DF|nr:DUF6155 family protein [Robiginitalea sp. SC105]MBC2840577.1 hypothetical protein [Robiginitalea sp. SC105]